MLTFQIHYVPVINLFVDMLWQYMCTYLVNIKPLICSNCKKVGESILAVLSDHTVIKCSNSIIGHAILSQDLRQVCRYKATCH